MTEQYGNFSGEENVMTAAMLSGMMPVALSDSLMFSDGSNAIFVPNGKELYFDQKCVAIKKLAEKNGLDVGYYISSAMQDPSRVDDVLRGLKNEIVGSKEMGETEEVSRIERNSQIFESSAMVAGFKRETINSVLRQVRAELENMRGSELEGDAPVLRK